MSESMDNPNLLTGLPVSRLGTEMHNWCDEGDQPGAVPELTEDPANSDTAAISVRGPLSNRCHGGRTVEAAASLERKA